MVSLRRILGVVIVLLGLVMVVLPYSGTFSATTTAPDMNSAVPNAFTAPLYGSGSVKFTWSGAASNTTVTLYSCPNDPSCGSATSYTGLHVVGSGTGASGSFTAGITGGTTYILAENGTTGGLTLTYALSGLDLDAVLGIVVLIVGLVLIALPGPKVAPSAAPAASASATPAPEEVVYSVPPSETNEAPVVSAPPVPAVTAEEAEPYAVPSPAVPAGGSNRPPIKCANCGTMNEPWITNCRWCKRPLSSTG